MCRTHFKTGSKNKNVNFESQPHSCRTGLICKEKLTIELRGYPKPTFKYIISYIFKRVLRKQCNAGAYLKNHAQLKCSPYDLLDGE